jgi:hypothetical protein
LPDTRLLRNLSEVSDRLVLTVATFKHTALSLMNCETMVSPNKTRFFVGA